jgi:hypothetical protein
MSVSLSVNARAVPLTRRLTIPNGPLRTSQGHYDADARQNAGS